MDIKPRLLLRRYASSRDLTDAAAFVNAFLLSGEPVEAPVWVVQSLYDRNEADNITLFDSSERAYEHAAVLVVKILTDEVGDWNDPEELDEDTPPWMFEAHQAYIDGHYEHVVNLYEDNQQSGWPIQVYSQNVR